MLDEPILTAETFGLLEDALRGAESTEDVNDDATESVELAYADEWLVDEPVDDEPVFDEAAEDDVDEVEELVAEAPAESGPTLEERYDELVGDVADLFAAEQAARAALAEELAGVSAELAAEREERAALAEVVDALAERLAELEAAAASDAAMIITESYVGPDRRSSAERRRGLDPREGRRTRPLRAQREPEPVEPQVEEPAVPMVDDVDEAMEDVLPEPQPDRWVERLDEVVGGIGGWQSGELDRLRRS